MIESKYLKDNVQNIQRLMAIPGLKDFETRNLAKLLRLSKIREYEDGELIIREGEEDPWLYFLLSGRIKIKKNDVEIARIDRVGEIFGEMRIVDFQNRSASVFADGRTICLGVDTSAKGRLATATVEERDARLDFLLLLYRIFAEYMSIRLRATNDELVKARTDLEKLKK
ncbi:MAG: cyclic nucleotide-binding domain-containing protein [Desulfobacterales bacterium]|jgi:CRP-like cAMP-binding protein|nr:cyclic nucleotide-binding domain-containing protein [Desulfobacterales bacterium]